MVDIDSPTGCRGKWGDQDNMEQAQPISGGEGRTESWVEDVREAERRAARLPRLDLRALRPFAGPAGARRRWIDTAAGRAEYVVAGSGPPVVLLHGLDGSSRWWTPTLRALTPHYRCHALEFVAFDSWRERGRVPLARAGAFVAAWLDALGLDWAHVVAHSMGTHAALELARDRPERLGRLVLIAPAIRPGALPTLRDAGRTLSFMNSIAPGFLPVLVADSLRTGFFRWLRSAHELLTAPPPHLDAVRAPTLLLWGDRDPLVPPGNGPLLQRQIAGSRLLYLPGAGHVPMYERAAACNRAIARFLAGEEVDAP